MATFKEMLEDDKITLNDLTEHLRKLDKDARIEEVLQLKKKHQMKLWDLAKDAPVGLDLDYLVPKDAKVLDPYPFAGKNSLPVFTHFKKVFYKQSNGEIGGYNDSPIAWLIGWGYMVVEKNSKNPKELGVNYLRIPEEKPEGWPVIKSNSSGLTRFVYGNMIDYLRWVSEDVLIGRAYRAGETEMPNWFVLCRMRFD